MSKPEKHYRDDGWTAEQTSPGAAWRVVAPTLDGSGGFFVIADGLEEEHARLLAEAPEMKKKLAGGA
jgi:hypothetical protein